MTLSAAATRTVRSSPLLSRKLQRLRRALRATGGCVVAYSGGVDSGLLLAVAREQLGDRAVAALDASPRFARRETDLARDWLRRSGAPHVVLRTAVRHPRFAANAADRCYHCKRALFRGLLALAARRGLGRVVEGSNRDDRAQVRPGRRAGAELGVLRPLDQAGLTKAEVRVLARRCYHLPMAGKPSQSCLATRLPPGSRLTPGRLRRVERMEDRLHALGFRIFRARLRPGEFRLELGPGEEERLLRPRIRRACLAAARDLGVARVTLDLQGFSTGGAPERARLRPGRPRRASGPVRG